MASHSRIGLRGHFGLNRPNWNIAWHDRGVPLPTATPSLSELRQAAEANVPQMVETLEQFVNIESPSHEVELLTASAHFLADLMTRLLGTPPTIIESSEGPHVHWKDGDNAKVLIVGHHDTVFPVGTVANRKFSREGDIVRGPGIFDMKAGIVQAIYGL